MHPLPEMRVIGIALLVLLTAGFAAPATASNEDEVTDLIATIFQDVPESAHMAVVLADNRERVYRAFYLSTYADVKELRAYVITYYNVMEHQDQLPDIAALLAEGEQAQVLDLIVGVLEVTRGSQYISDIGLDGIHDEEVPVGSGRMRDRFHPEQFSSTALAHEAYMDWLRIAAAMQAAGD